MCHLKHGVVRTYLFKIIWYFQLLENLVSVAEKAKDYQCADYVTSVFLSEQIKSIDKFAHHVTQLGRLCDEPSLYLYDSKLAETHPIKYKLNPS